MDGKSLSLQRKTILMAFVCVYLIENSLRAVPLQRSSQSTERNTCGNAGPLSRRHLANRSVCLSVCLSVPPSVVIKSLSMLDVNLKCHNMLFVLKVYYLFFSDAIDSKLFSWLILEM